MNYYTDPVLLDVAGAVEALPNFAADENKFTLKNATVREGQAGDPGV